MAVGRPTSSESRVCKERPNPPADTGVRLSLSPASVWSIVDAVTAMSAGADYERPSVAWHRAVDDVALELVCPDHDERVRTLAGYFAPAIPYRDSLAALELRLPLVTNDRRPAASGVVEAFLVSDFA